MVKAKKAERAPQRTCIGCRARADKSELVRYVGRLEEERIVIERDEVQQAPGRGTYVHPGSACLEAAVRRRAFRRALRIAPGFAAQLAEPGSGHQAGTSM